MKLDLLTTIENSGKVKGQREIAYYIKMPEMEAMEAEVCFVKLN